MCCHTLQRAATHRNTPHHTAYTDKQHQQYDQDARQMDCITLHHTATQCNTMQYPTSHCNTLQHAALRYEQTQQ